MRSTCLGDTRRTPPSRPILGSLVNVVVHRASFAQAAFGVRAPSRVPGFADPAPGGADRQAPFVLAWEGGALASCAPAVTHETAHDAWITGSGGRIRVH